MQFNNKSDVNLQLIAEDTMVYVLLENKAYIVTRDSTGKKVLQEVTALHS